VIRFFSLVFILQLASSPLLAADIAFRDVRALLDAHCVKCHGDKTQKAGVNLVPFADEKAVLKQRRLWRSVIVQLQSGDMPPEGEKELAKEQRERFINWIKQSLAGADKADREKPDPGRSVIRRLNRSEYNRTIRDLTGIDFDFAGTVGLPDEASAGSFDNLAAALNLSSTQMEKCFAGADLVLEKLYATPKDKKPKGKSAYGPALDKLIVARPAEGLSAHDAAKKVVESFARKAYRRPVEPREVDRLVALFDRASAKEPVFEESLRPVFKAIMASPNFLLRIERDRETEAERAYRISDHEVAVRLSYFLWSSMPDAELSALADKSALSKPEVLEKQVRRMLADPKAHALTDNFAAQWLQLRKLVDARPSTEFFPTFTPKLRQAMYDEAAMFFDKLREEDRSLLELLDADYTYVNADLAKHYGIDGGTGPDFRKVTLTDGNRGGLLGMSAPLALTSHTSRTSPTLRGKYVLEVILGTPPPPPPPNVSQIDESKNKGKAAKTFREQLALHATQATCANCHKRIDPLGFGLENFDAIGRWRPSSAEVNASGNLPTGEKFDGPKELKKILLQRKGRFVENMTEKLTIYALGRELQSSDEVHTRKIVEGLEQDGYRFSRLVLGIVQSYAFQHRRNPKQDERAE